MRWYTMRSACTAQSWGKHMQNTPPRVLVGLVSHTTTCLHVRGTPSPVSSPIIPIFITSLITSLITSSPTPWPSPCKFNDLVNGKPACVGALPAHDFTRTTHETGKLLRLHILHRRQVPEDTFRASRDPPMDKTCWTGRSTLPVLSKRNVAKQMRKCPKPLFSSGPTNRLCTNNAMHLSTSHHQPSCIQHSFHLHLQIWQIVVLIRSQS